MLTRFFDKHVKLRIAVQLLLDVMPMLLMIGGVEAFAAGLGPIRPAAVEGLMSLGLILFLIGTAPVFALSVWLAKDMAEFEIWPFWGKVSLMLRCFSAAPAIISVYLLLLLLCWVFGL